MNRRILAALSLLPLYSGTLFAEGTYSVGFGSEYSSGDYGTGNTATLWSVPISLNYQADKWGWGISVPYLILRSSGDVVVGSGGMIGTGPGVIGGGGAGGGGGMSTTATTTTTTVSGLGDVTLRGSVEITEEGKLMPWMGFTLKAKIATADENKFLGTGENDYAAQLEMVKGMVGGYAGYKILGDPAYVNFNNVAYGALNLSHYTSDTTRFTLEGYLEQPIIDGNDPKREVSLIVSHKLNEGRRISAYVLKGFSDASPDWGAGIVFKYSL